MQTRSSSALATTARLTSYAPAAAPLPTVPPQAPPPTPGTADRKSSKREREGEASLERSPSPLARRAQPLTVLGRPSESRASDSGTPDFAAATPLRTRTAGTPAPAPVPAQSAAGQPPESTGQAAFSDSPILAIVAAYAAREQPLAYLSGLRQALESQPDVDAKARNTLLRERPEALLEVHPDFRSEDDYRRYFEAGGSLEKLASSPLNPAIRQMAIEAHPLDLKFVVHRSLGLCRAAVRRDGYALEFVPPALLASGSDHREELVELAYASPRPPRVRHVPRDLQTEARCIRSLQWAPLDLADVDPDVITFQMCEAWLGYLPTAFTPDISVIPQRLRDEQMARLLMPLPKQHRDFTFPGRAWHLEGALTPGFSRDYLMAYPQEIVATRVFTEPVPLAVLGDVLQAQGAEFRFLGLISWWVDAFGNSAYIGGLSISEEIPTGRWREGLLPRHYDRREAYLWAIERIDDVHYDHIPDDLRQDEAILLAVLRRSKALGLKPFPPEFLRRHADVVAQVILQSPDNTFSPSDMCHLHHMGASWINETLQKLIAEYPSYDMIDVYANDFAALLTDDTRAALNAWREARLSHPHSFAWEDLRELPQDTWTQEMCEPLLDGSGWGYLELPARLRTLPLLLIALRTEPGILKHLPVDEVTQEIALRAMVEAGILPGLVPPHIRDSPSFVEALGGLPECAYHPTAIDALIDELHEQHVNQEHGGTGLDEFNRTWIEKLLQQDPSRALDFSPWDRLHWGVRAYQEGGASLDDVRSRLLPALLPDFLAAVGPFAAGRVTPAGASGSALASLPQPARAPE